VPRDHLGLAESVLAETVFPALVKAMQGWWDKQIPASDGLAGIFATASLARC
jgi:hypothetical protein